MSLVNKSDYLSLIQLCVDPQNPNIIADQHKFQQFNSVHVSTQLFAMLVDLFLDVQVDPSGADCTNKNIMFLLKAQIRNMILDYYQFFDNVFIAEMYNKLVRNIEQVQKQQMILQIVSLIGVWYYDQKTVQQIVKETIIHINNSYVNKMIIRNLVEEFSNVQKLKERKNKYSFIQNNFELIFQTILINNPDELCCQILVYSILCLDDSTKEIDDHVLRLTKNKANKMVVMNCIQKVFNNLIEVICQKLNVEYNNGLIKLLTVIIRMEDRYFGDNYSNVWNQFLQIVEFVIQKEDILNSILMMRLVNFNNELQKLQNPKYQQLIVLYIQNIVHQNYTKLQVQFKIHVLEFYCQFNIECFKNVDDFKLFQNIDKQFILDDFVNNYCRHSADDQQYYLELIVRIFFLEFAVIYEKLVHNKTIDQNILTMIFQYLSVLLNNTQCQQFFDQNLNLQLVQNISLILTNLDKMDTELQTFFISKFIHNFFHNQQFNENKQIVLNYLQEILKFGNIADVFQHLLVNIMRLNEAQLLQQLVDCLDQKYDKTSEKQQLIIGLQMINEQYFQQTIVAQHLQDCYAQLQQNKEMRKCIYMMIGKVLEIYYDNVHDKKVMEEVINSIFRVYFRNDGCIDFKYLLNDFHVLIQNQFLNPSFYQKQLRKVFMEILEQPQFKQQFESILQNIQQKQNHHIVKTFIKIQVNLFNKVSNFKNNDEYHDNLFIVLELIDKIKDALVQNINNIDSNQKLKIILNISKIFNKFELFTEKIVNIVTSFFKFIDNKQLFNLKSNVELKRLFRSILQKDYLKLASDNNFYKIVDFMEKTLEEEDREENCLKFFFFWLHGLFFENSYNYYQDGKQKYLYIYDLEQFNQKVQIAQQNSLNISVDKLIEMVVLYMLNKRVTVSDSFSKLLMTIYNCHKQKYENILSQYIDFYGGYQIESLMQLLNQFNQGIPSQINKETIAVFNIQYQQLIKTLQEKY